MDHDIPALHGGRPMRKTMLAYGQQWLDEADIESVVQVLRGDFITQGPKISEFEGKVAAYAGVRFAVAFSSGTGALHGACFAAGIGSGDEVITTPMTFLASSNCILYQGGTPIFADIKPDTYNIDPEEIERLLTSRTKAIIPVDFTGQPVEIDSIMDLANRHNLTVIHDAAHSFGAEYKGKKIGTWAHMTMFSFHPVKHVTTGEGGVIVTDDETFYRKLLLFRNHGITKDPEVLWKNDGPWYYEMQELGYHYRITDMQAALGVSQMDKLDDFVQRRRDIAHYYSETLRGIDGISVPEQHPDALSSWHLYVIRLDLDKFSVSRKELFEALRAENIGVHVHYIPVHLQPYYQKLGYTKGICPIAEDMYQRILTLPLFPRMTDNDIRDVVAAVHKVLRYYLISSTN
ncbi:UDP-4-amino-4,6-dideoxy-N-acetyl-beta-L-altrosamine transaminase [Cohnella silvisoli]|uniref:UDP-4-amino-4, 6-dideoxy-N-acetyl-beta-L-altrosamine transaminase n=1 Tax=Cohnella silvisoli TaxID=2873699 RepID=A0ABV1KPL5_9BACL|nr:UDP-4-amino-4,6-dideoxy-N-acetyl-beta-L-altrosamine transaminase [Cohnella silvisoli]MCD9022322.1 UDP-4-amino-4,6-dideoxy-N-acetyl-beta-L-altrosamine transaminase [Cohnella silvisoli]